MVRDDVLDCRWVWPSDTRNRLGRVMAMKQRDFWGGGVLNRTEARVYLQYMLRMLKESRK